MPALSPHLLKVEDMGLSARTLAAIQAASPSLASPIRNAADLAGMHPQTLLKMKGLGRAALAEIRSVLAHHGLSSDIHPDSLKMTDRILGLLNTASIRSAEREKSRIQYIVEFGDPGSLVHETSSLHPITFRLIRSWERWIRILELETDGHFGWDGIEDTRRRMKRDRSFRDEVHRIWTRLESEARSVDVAGPRLEEAQRKLGEYLTKVRKQGLSAQQIRVIFRQEMARLEREWAVEEVHEL